MKLISTLLLFLLFSLVVPVQRNAVAQESDVGAWFAFAGQGSLGEPDTRWRWWLDAHARFFEESDGFETSILRPGAGYRVTDQVTTWLGYAWIYNDTRNGSFDEHRIWQQLIWSDSYAWGTPFLRSRLEQRFEERGSEVGWRLRQFVRWTRPIEAESRFNFRAWDEVFIDLNDTAWGQNFGFSQNRAFLGLGWNLDDTGRHTLEFGYLNQYIQRGRARDSMNHILGVTLI
ncbi:MAG: DUF2490 domain-containing protein [Planctomycetota bacterium]